MNTIEDIYADFYKTNYVWPISSAAMAANLAFKYLQKKMSKLNSIVLPTNASNIMLDAAHDSSVLETSFCDITTHDFGLDPNKLNETTASIVYAQDSYGVASSYCAGTQGRFVIEDMLESSFSPHTGTGHIFYTGIPGNKDVAILMTREHEIAAFLNTEIIKLGLKLSAEYTKIIYELLQQRHNILLDQISAAHTLLKMLPSSIKTSNILCNYFSKIPLILPKDVSSFISHSNTGDYLYKVDGLTHAKNIMVLELLDTNIKTLAGIANRITHYLELP